MAAFVNTLPSQCIQSTLSDVMLHNVVETAVDTCLVEAKVAPCGAIHTGTLHTGSTANRVSHGDDHS